MNTTHNYELTTVWQGNLGTGTSGVADYKRTHTIAVPGKPLLTLTTDDALYGDRSILNPEDLLVAALSSCHMMSYLYLCAKARVVVTAYEDHATGLLEQEALGGGRFLEVTLRPIVEVTDPAMVERALHLHHQAQKICYIASSVNFPIHHLPEIRIKHLT
jgi:organic hydroperoxide reductase OsmC/OhrA